MDNDVKESWWQAHRPSTRRLIQLYSALLHNAHVRGLIDGEIYQGKAKFACVPGLNCYSCPAASAACPLGALQNALSSSGHRAGWYMLGILLLFGTVLGRTVCGWLCPFGLIQELLHSLPSFKIRKSRVTRLLSWLKYVILVIFAAAMPLWYGLKHDMPFPGFCKYICPAGTLEGAMGLLSNPRNSELFGMLGIFFTRKFVILVIIVLACIFCYRSFCRFLCPLGAIYGLFNRFCLVGVKVDTERCNGCGLCVRSCGMDVKHVGDHECIQELPHFTAFYHEHEDDVAMLAVHSSMVLDDPAQFLADKGWDIPFALDTDSDMVWGIVNGSSTIPQTIVLNRRGEVIVNRKGSVTPEMLATFYEQAAG